MKIRKLSIKGFKNIRNFQMEQIPDLVVLAGPNGCGKTSVFDAIRFFKSMVGPYSGSELATIQSNELGNDWKNIVNLRASFSEVTLGIEPSASEKGYLLSRFTDLSQLLARDGGLLTSTVHIDKGGGYSVSQPSPPLSELLRHYDPTDEIGTFEYIPSIREITRGEMGSVAVGPGNIEQEKLECTAAPKQKFYRLKQYLVLMLLYDKMKLLDRAGKFMPEIQSFFGDFFFPKQFEGVDVDRSLRWHFPVKTPDGTHDIDHLSSGELEILMTYTNMLKMKLTGSVILFDEPELHLNAALERKVVGRLKRIVDAGNQVWVSTHSLEIIGTLPLENLYRMYVYPPEGKDNQVELCSTKEDRFQTLKLLGASTGIQLISQRIVYVEGPTDKETLQTLFEEYGDLISFVETKGVSRLMSLGELLSQATKYDSIYMIRDRDFMTNNEVESIGKKFGGKVFIWKKRSLDNYLLDPKIIMRVLSLLGIKIFDGEDAVLSALKSIAEDLRCETLGDLVKFEINRRLGEVVFGFPSFRKENELEESVVRLAEEKRDSVIRTLEKDSIKTIIKEKKDFLSSSWNTQWSELCYGKRVLQEFINRHMKPQGSHIEFALFRRLIVGQMKEASSVPDDINAVMTKVTEGLPKTPSAR